MLNRIVFVKAQSSMAEAKQYLHLKEIEYCRHGSEKKGKRGILEIDVTGIKYTTTFGKRVEVITIRRNKIETLEVINVGTRGSRTDCVMLAVHATDGQYEFHGLSSSHYDALQKFMVETKDEDDTAESVTLVKREQSQRGWNWGDLAVADESVRFSIGGHPVFGIPLRDIERNTLSSSSTKGNNAAELTMELTVPEEVRTHDHVLSKVHMYIPRDQDSAALAKQLDRFTVDRKKQMIAEFGKTSANAPRANFTSVAFQEKCVEFLGRQDYRVLYRNISHVFVLPVDGTDTSNTTVFVALALRTPIKNNKIFMLRFIVNDRTVCPLAFSDPDELDAFNKDNADVAEDLAEIMADGDVDMDDKAAPAMSDLMKDGVYSYVAFSRLVQYMAQCGLTEPGFDNDNLYKGERSFHCTLTTRAGRLFPLSHCFFFIGDTGKPELIPYDSIANIKQGKVGGRRDFQVVVEYRHSKTASTLFSAIPRKGRSAAGVVGESGALDSFRRLLTLYSKLTNKVDWEGANAGGLGEEEEVDHGDEDDEDDTDFADSDAGESDEEDAAPIDMEGKRPAEESDVDDE